MSPRVIVFAKAPIRGTVKTRLAAHLGTEGAASLHAELVVQTLRTANAAGVGPVELCCAPDARHSFFARCALEYGVSLSEQGAGDLGERMRRAFARTEGPTVLVGSDCPAMTPQYLRAAARALRAGADAVVGPAEDGGYVLIGLSRPVPALFEGIEWGSHSVLATTRVRLARLGSSWRELETLWDVDRPADYRRYRNPTIFDAGVVLPCREGYGRKRRHAGSTSPSRRVDEGRRDRRRRSP